MQINLYNKEKLFIPPPITNTPLLLHHPLQQWAEAEEEEGCGG